ncbi:MAG: exo-beta-N-acetylmuramidase NamZ family protein [Janthinobacterium lividum]
MMKWILPAALAVSYGAGPRPVEHQATGRPGSDKLKPSLQTGAEQLPVYLPWLRGQRVGLVVNQTSRLGTTYLADTLHALHVNLTAIFAPEHGFRGEAADGATITDGRDARTGVPVRSVYGKTKKPTPDMLADVDVLVFDIQDVGTRFYTFISTLHYVMEAAAEQGKQVVVLDRPNPNGRLVDGPVLEPAHRSFVGLDPLPICHGLTVGELARMINGEHWLAGQRQCRLRVVPMQGYTHALLYALPVRPSPNLPTARAVALYPSVCLLEGTNVSVGRGTDRPFELIGAPTQPATRPYQFTPRPNAGSPTPPLQGRLCYGRDLHQPAPREPAQEFTLRYLLDFYQQSTDKAHFFSKYFEELSGTDSLRAQVVAGRSEASIRASWEPKLGRFKALREKYLLYLER